MIKAFFKYAAMTIGFVVVCAGTGVGTVAFMSWTHTMFGLIGALVWVLVVVGAIGGVCGVMDYRERKKRGW